MPKSSSDLEFTSTSPYYGTALNYGDAMSEDLKERVELFNEGFGEIALRSVGSFIYEAGQFLVDIVMILTMTKALLWVFSSSSGKGHKKVTRSVIEDASEVLLSEIERGLRENFELLDAEADRSDVVSRFTFSVDLNRLLSVLDAETGMDLSGESVKSLRKGIFKAVDRAFGDDKVKTKLYEVMRIYHEDELREAIEMAMGGRKVDYDQMIQKGSIDEVGADLLPRKLFFGLTTKLPIR